jgi:hypothetical protein
MRKRRLLLAATALSAACSNKTQDVEPIHGNPKGSFYDARVEPLPGNPKGTMYDAGLGPDNLPPPDVWRSEAGLASDAAITDAVAPADGPKAPNDAPVIRPLPGNPKGSFYDAGIRKPKNPGDDL